MSASSEESPDANSNGSDEDLSPKKDVKRPREDSYIYLIHEKDLRHYESIRMKA